MDKVLQPLPPVVRVVAGQVATLDIPIGPRYHVIWLEATVKKTGAGAAITDILDLIKVKVNGKTQREHTVSEVAQLLALLSPDNALRWQISTDDAATFAALGQTATATTNTVRFQLPIYFAEPWRKSCAATDVMAWPTVWQDGSQLRTLQLEIVIPNVANTTLLVPREARDVGIGVTPLEIPQYYPVGASA